MPRLLAILYRDLRLWLVQVITLALAVAAMVASMKLLHRAAEFVERPRLSVSFLRSVLITESTSC